MKMSLFGSSRGCSRFQLARAVRTSSRSCSAACRLFFESDVVALAEPPHRTGANRNAAPAQPATNFFQRQVRFGGDQLQQPLLVSIQRRALAAHGLGGHRSSLPPARNPPDRRTRAYLKRCRGFMTRGSRLHCTHHPSTQVTRIGLRHRCLPRIINSSRLADRQTFMNPNPFASDSTQSDYALSEHPDRESAIARVEADIESRMERVLHDWELYRAGSGRNGSPEKWRD